MEYLGFLLVLAVVVVIALISKHMEGVTGFTKGDCELHDWNWEAKVKGSGHIIICKKCRMRPNLDA